MCRRGSEFVGPGSGKLETLDCLVALDPRVVSGHNRVVISGSIRAFRAVVVDDANTPLGHHMVEQLFRVNLALLFGDVKIGDRNLADSRRAVKN